MMTVLMCGITGYSHAQTGVPITINPSPTQYAVTGGGSYCAGGVGLPVGLAGSQVGVSYTLLYNGATIVSQINGTGSALTFGLQTNGGTYTIEGLNTTTSCDILMTGSATITVNAIPNINLTASGPVEFCGSGSVTLTATANITTAAYQWYKNGVIIGGANNNAYTASQAGMYTVVVTNTITGCSNDASQMVEMHPLPQQFVVSASSTTFCQGGTVTINQNSSYSGVNYQLFLNGAITGSPVVGTGNALAWSVNTAGTYTVQATDAITGCQSMMSGSVTVTMNPLPAAAGAITGPTDVCQNATVTYSTAAITNASTYTWSVPTWTTIVSGQGTSQITLFVNTAGVSGNITVMGQNACGGGAISSIAINVMAAPTVNATATPGNICAGNSTTINAGGNGTSFVWSGGMTTQSAVVYPTGNTTYNVTVTGSNGCTTSGNVSVTVHQLPTVTLTLPETNFCQNDQPITVTGGSPAGGTYTGNCIFNNQFVPSATTPGGYTVTYTYSDGYGCSGTASQDVVFNQAVLPVFLNVPGPIYINTPGFYLTGYVSPSGGTFEGPGVVGNMFNPAVAGVGTHMITYYYTHPTTGCTGSQIQWIVVSPGDEPGNSVESIAAAHAVAIYPNPASEILNLSGINTQEIISLQVIDITGRIIYENGNLDEDIQINLNNFLPGNYIIRFFDRDGMSVSKKFMKN